MKKTVLFCVGILVIFGVQSCQEDIHFSERIPSYTLGTHTAFRDLHPVFAEYRALNDLKVFPTLDDGFLTYHAHERRNSFALSKYNANFEADWQLAFPLAFPKADTEENNLKEHYLYKDYVSTELIGVLEVDNQLFLYFADSAGRLREFEVDARSGKIAHHFILDDIIKLDRDPECLYEVFRAQTDSRKIDVQYCFVLGERGQTEVIAVDRSIGTSEACPNVQAEEFSLELSGDILRFYEQMPGQDKKLIFPPVLITYGPSKQYKKVTLEAFYRLEDNWYFAGILLEDYEKNKILLSVQIKENENTYFDYFHFGDVNSRWIKIEDKVFLVKNDYTIEIWEADPYKRQIYSFNIIDDHKAWVHDVKTDERNNLWVAGLVNDNLNFFIQRIPNKQLD